MTDKLLIDRELLTDLRDAASECLDREDRQRRQMIYSRLVSDSDAILAQSAPEPVQGEAVEVVGMRIRTDGFGSYIADFAMGVPAAMPGEVREQLMTVAQHQRIMAAAVPAGCKAVPVDLIERTICRLTHGHEHDKAVRELRALLASAEGVKDE